MNFPNRLLGTKPAASPCPDLTIGFRRRYYLGRLVSPCGGHVFVFILNSLKIVIGLFHHNSPPFTIIL